MAVPRTSVRKQISVLSHQASLVGSYQNGKKDNIQSATHTGNCENPKIHLCLHCEKKNSHNSNFIIFSQMKALVMLRFLALELNFYHVGGRSGSPPKKLIFREKNQKISTEIP